MTIRHQPAAKRPARIVTRVVLLLPEALWRLRPSIARWASELRHLLQRHDLELILSEGGRHYRTNPTVHLEKLVQSHPHSAWVLFARMLAMQT